ncbi:MAG: DUF4990 domain-containing protein [Planctomycetes bacterium]|nr:DUF4990 domain-containing protein [Planctomycetota bacterium]
MARILPGATSALVLIATLAHACGAAEYVIAPDGDDAHTGTLAQPFASVTRAQAAAAPGDTVLIRGGTYHVREEQIARKVGIFAHVFTLDKSGTQAAPINYVAYHDEQPVFDFAQVRAEGLRIIAFHVSGSWLRFKGFAVTGVQVTIKTHTQSECFENLGSDNIYENLAMHDGQAIGLYLVGGSDNLILNCDAYRNHDHVSEDGSGGNTDGFGCHPRSGSTGNVFRGCRAWFNSDDGYDCITACEAVVFDHCWAMDNGYSTSFTGLGDGNGFKAGGWARTPTARLPRPMPRHTVRFCLAVHNRASGFYANHHLQGGDWLGNSAYRNGNDYNMLERVNDADGEHFDLNVPGAGHVLKNNLGYKGGRELTNLDAAHSEVAANSFDLGLTITDADFISVDEAQLVQPRKADGSLPDVTFMHLAPGSQFIDRGVEIGFPFAGKHPDVGCFESR